MDSGDGVSHTIPVFDGHILTDYIQRLNVAGRHVTEYLIKLLLIRGYAFNSSADFEIVRDIKEKFGYIAHDIERERKLCQETCVLDREYVLPNKKVIRIGRERFEAGECMFQPHLIDCEQGGIHDLIFDTINASPMDTRKRLYGNILLTGGSTMFPGFPTRVVTEVKNRFKRDIMKGRDYDSGIDIKVIDPFTRKHSVFIGGSFFAGIPAIGWVSKEQYEEEGDRCLGSSTSI